MEGFKVVITDNLFPHVDEERRIIEEAGGTLEVHRYLEGRELKEALRDAHAVLVNQVKLDKEILESMECCRVISRYGVGYDNVDVAAAQERGIEVTIVPGYCRYEVAEHAAALLYSCARNIPGRNRAVREGRWRNDVTPPLYRIRGSVLGIVGWGATGRAFYEQMQGAGFSRILVATRSAKDLGAPPPVIRVSLEKLLRKSDYISLHIPLNEETRGLIDEEAISLMKERAVLINTSRGGVVDETALAEALKHRRIRAAGLDVLCREEPATDNPLFKLPNVVISDHQAYYSEESLSELKEKAAAQAVAVLQGSRPDGLLPRG